jgi:hypothetical protein
MSEKETELFLHSSSFGFSPLLYFILQKHAQKIENKSTSVLLVSTNHALGAFLFDSKEMNRSQKNLHP